MEPGSETIDVTKSSKKLLNNYSRYPVRFSYGDGIFLYDTEGKKYYDFLCGIAVTSLGHNNSVIKKAVQKQFDSYWHVSNLFESAGQEELAEKLSAVSGIDNVFFCNSGTEANEAAIKFARMRGGEKFEIISALGGFHGRTFGSLSATGQFKLWKDFQPMLPGFSYVPFGKIEAIKNSITNYTCAVMLEAIQGEGGINIASTEYLKEVRELCDEKGLLLIMDEVQSGFGRTGEFFAYQHAGILPDIASVAKSIANGLPLGATLCSKEVGDLMIPGSHGSTFGGNPVAVAAANAVIDIIDDNMLKHIEDMGKFFLAELKRIKSSSLKEVRGKGLMIGVEFNEAVSAKKIAKLFLERGFITGTSGESVLRILPPFLITKQDISIFTEALEKLLTETAFGQISL
jgi:acetylornithine/N-succinyldiaminopimelate aminotransferase